MTTPAMVRKVLDLLERMKHEEFELLITLFALRSDAEMMTDMMGDYPQEFANEAPSDPARAFDMWNDSYDAEMLKSVVARYKENGIDLAKIFVARRKTTYALERRFDGVVQNLWESK